MGYRFEFDSVNKVLLLRVEGRFTDELLAQDQQLVRKYWTATSATAAIVDYSSVTEFALSAELIRSMARRELVADAIPRVIIAPVAVGFGLSRMFQIVGEDRRTLHVVHTMEEALKALGIQSPHFEPLD